MGNRKSCLEYISNNLEEIETDMNIIKKNLKKKEKSHKVDKTKKETVGVDK